TLAMGALRDYFRREEHFGIRAVGDMTEVSYRQSMFRDPVDEEVLTRKVLEQVTTGLGEINVAAATQSPSSSKMINSILALDRN
ncbi:MAG TPA: hypothetical protein VFU48_06770, partial [Nitrospira sp.]|nr:hypothetical protein [Nitrospira sp.]